MKHKLRLLLVPYLVISALSIVLFSAFCFYVYNQQGTSGLDEEFVNFWIPYCFPWIPVLIWLRPRIKTLKFNRTGRRSPDFGFCFIAVLAIAAPCMITALYIQTEAGKLSTLNNVNEINKYPVTEYYSIKNFYVDKDHSSIYYASVVSGRYNSDLDLSINIACPIYVGREESFSESEREITKIGVLQNSTNDGKNQDTIKYHEPLILIDGAPSSKADLANIAKDSISKITVLKAAAATTLYGSSAQQGAILVTTKRVRQIIDEEARLKPPKAWLCIKYHKSIRNHQDDEKKKDQEHEFYESSMKSFSDTNVNIFSYLQRLGNNTDHRHFKIAVERAAFDLQENEPIILVAENGNYNKRSGNKLLWIFLSYLIGLTVWTIASLIPKFDEERLSVYLNKRSIT